MTTNLQVTSQKQLKQFIEQIERLESDKKGIADDIRDKYAEAKAVGFDPKIMRQVVRIRQKTKAEFVEEEAVLASYLHAVSWLDTPLGRTVKEPPKLSVVE